MENLKNEVQNFMQEMVENNLNLLRERNSEYAQCKEEIKNNIKAIIDEDKHYDYSLEKINNNNYDKLLID